MHYGGAVDLDHFELASEVAFVEAAIGAEAGVVDEKFDFEGFGVGERADLGGGGRICEIGGKNFNFDSVRGTQVDGEGVEAVFAAGGDDEVCVCGSEFFGES